MNARAAKRVPANQRLRRINGGFGHWYKLDGEYAPGVTTVLGRGLAVPFDVPSQWAARLVAEYAAEHRDWLTQAPNSQAIVEVLRAVPRNTRDEAAAKGTTVHGYAEQLHQRGTVDLADEHSHLMSHVERHADLLDQWGIETHATEVACANTQHGYAGTVDLLCTSSAISTLISELLAADGQPELPPDAIGLLDLKTGNGVRDKDHCQVEAYARCDLAHIDGAEVAMPPIGWVGIIHTQADHSTLHLAVPSYRARVWRLFLAALFEWRALDSKRGWIDHAHFTPETPTTTEEAA